MDEEKIRNFLSEDIGYGDITSNSILEPGKQAKAKIMFRESGVVAGLEEAGAIFSLLGCTVKLMKNDGEITSPGQTVMEVGGLAKAILAGERTALNILGRMSGIASAVNTAIAKVAEINSPIRIAATRKTAPGLRELDKKAVELAGGDTHRLRLDDCVLIKDNHLKLGLSITEAVERARKKASFTKKIEVEVTSLKEAEEAVEAGADIVMFDNMSPSEIKQCLSTLKKRDLLIGRLFEASGGINLDNLKEYADSGVDIVSMGSLTHSIKSLNVKLEIAHI